MTFDTKAKVTLVGAGPGDKDLITVKGLRALQSADVVLYDALVDEALLDETPAETIKLFVGKRAGQPCKKQTEINELIVQSAHEYGHVVRLKGGDPFVFGRGMEEVEYIKAHDIEVSVVPGISSSISVPALQGVPVTSRGVSESFWVLTGSTKDHQISQDIEIALQSRATLIILMGMRKLAMIADMIKLEGQAHKAMMVIQSGSRADERCVIGTAEDIVAKSQAAQIGTPGIIVIGDVVQSHPHWIKEKANSTWTNH